MKNLDWAISYYQKGFSVFPLWRGTKNRPIVQWKKYITERASVEQLKDWWTQYPDANIAIITGLISGFFVLDTEKDFNLLNIEIPEGTPTVKTGSGGRHFYFKIPENVGVGTHVEIWGSDPDNKADIKSNGGYVVAPPSFNEEKQSVYEWLNQLENLSLPPEWLLLEIERKQKNRNVVRISDLVENVQEGNRNVSAASFIGHLLLKIHHSMWEIAAWPATIHWNSKINLPLDTNELRGVFDSIMRKEIVRQSGEESSDDLKNYDGPDKVISSHEMYDIVNVNSSDDIKFFSKSLGPLDRLCDGFVPGELIVVSGPEKSGKTSLLQFLTTSFAKQLLSCLWFTYEMTPREFLKKFKSLPIFYLPSMNKTYDLNWLEKRIIEAKLKYDIKFIMIDHLEYIVDVEISKNSAISLGAVVRRLKSIAREHELIVFLVHHIRRIEKGEVPGVRDLRDSALIAAEADSTVMIWRTPKNGKKINKKISEEIEYENDSVIKVCNHRRTGVIERSFRVKYNDGLYQEITDQFGEYENVLENGASLNNFF